MAFARAGRKVHAAAVETPGSDARVKAMHDDGVGVLVGSA